MNGILVVIIIVILIVIAYWFFTMPKSLACVGSGCGQLAQAIPVTFNGWQGDPMQQKVTQGKIINYE